jgi:RAB6A-GEF complex partner protein 2
MSTQSTNIRVFVQWTEQTVFAGEEVECQITFKNIATTPAPSKASLHPSTANGFASSGERQRKAPTTQIKTNSTLSPRPSPPNRGHRTTLSLTTPVGSVQTQSAPGSWNGGPPKVSKEGGTHKRSVSIISIGASEGGVEDLKSHGSLPERPRAISRGHGRSASLQIVPRRHGINGGPTSGK